MRCEECEAREAEIKDLREVAEGHREQAVAWARIASDRGAALEAAKELAREQAGMIVTGNRRAQALEFELSELKASGVGVVCLADEPHDLAGGGAGVCPKCYSEAMSRLEDYAHCDRCDDTGRTHRTLCSACWDIEAPK